jgi:hypothetical protein
MNGGYTVPFATITGINVAHFFISSATFSSPPTITGAITARTNMTFVVSRDFGTTNAVVNFNNVFDNAGNSVRIGRPRSGAINVNLCAPTASVGTIDIGK